MKLEWLKKIRDCRQILLDIESNRLARVMASNDCPEIYDAYQIYVESAKVDLYLAEIAIEDHK